MVTLSSVSHDQTETGDEATTIFIRREAVDFPGHKKIDRNDTDKKQDDYSGNWPVSFAQTAKCMGSFIPSLFALFNDLYLRRRPHDAPSCCLCLFFRIVFFTFFAHLCKIRRMCLYVSSFLYCKATALQVQGMCLRQSLP